MRISSTYKGGIDAVLTQYEGRRDSFGYAEGEGLDPLDTDLAALTKAKVGDPNDDPRYARPFRSSYHRKCHSLREEFIGQSELCCLHGLVVSHLRKRDWPDHAPALFQRLWSEQGTHLLSHLDPRWLVSAITTFGDHGANVTQRATGLAMTAFFGTMKLYESERLYSGRKPDTPFELDDRTLSKLPMDMEPYALTSGGLDVNLIARLWLEAEGCPVVAPLAHRLLALLIQDDRTIFRRLMTMRNLKARKDKHKARAAAHVAPVPARGRALSAETLRWGVVSTVKAPLAQIAGFVAHHLDLGAHAVHLHLDEPDPDAAAFLARHPAVHVVPCDDSYWQSCGKARMDAHQLRQAFNATRCLTACRDSLDLIAHFDVDEFLLSDTAVGRALAIMPPSAAFARIRPAEALARDDGPPKAFKLTHSAAGRPKTVLQDIYPTFGMHLYGGFLSHSAGKIIARTGIPDTRLGIHALKYQGEAASNKYEPADMVLAHLHAPSWEVFKAHLAFRMTHGSYRNRERETQLGQGDVIGYLAQQEGEPGLRALFDEVCTDTPVLRDRLRAQGMLIERDLDLDSKIKRVFGTLP